MEILVAVHVQSNWDYSKVSCAKISLEDSGIRDILNMSEQIRKEGEIFQSDEYTPEMGTTQADLGVEHYRNIEEFSATMEDDEIFEEAPNTNKSSVYLNVTREHFWWSGTVKLNSIRWETQKIPISFLLQSKRV